MTTHGVFRYKSEVGFSEFLHAANYQLMCRYQLVLANNANGVIRYTSRVGFSKFWTKYDVKKNAPLKSEFQDQHRVKAVHYITTSLADRQC